MTDDVLLVRNCYYCKRALGEMIVVVPGLGETLADDQQRIVLCPDCFHARPEQEWRRRTRIVSK